VNDLNEKIENLRKLAQERKVRPYEEKKPHIYEYQLTDSPSWLILFTVGIGLEEAERSLKDRYRERFITMRERK